MRTGIIERFGKIEDMDRSFDIEFWQAQEPAAIFAAAWELVVLSYIVKGKDVNELRLDRTIENMHRVEG